ncbi:MAG: ribosome maturation factor RimM [Holosporaceae bacterium]|jgi:16S rRNA processing protein RimM|nr:ribosome maturation factor RimM [Holosporaceae bacterium]
MIEILRVAGAFGTRGALRVVTLSHNLSHYKKVYDGQENAFSFCIIRFLGGNKLAISIENINDRNAAESLKGKIFYVKKSDLPQIRKNEVYFCDLIGREVRVMDSDIVCKITDVKNYGAGDLIEVSHGNETFLVPYTQENFPDSDDQIIMTLDAFNGFKD